MLYSNLIRWIPSLVAFSRFSTSSFISLVILLFPYPEWSRFKYAQLLPNLQDMSIWNLLQLCGCFSCRIWSLVFYLAISILSWWQNESSIFRNFWSSPLSEWLLKHWCCQGKVEGPGLVEPCLGVNTAYLWKNTDAFWSKTVIFVICVNG